MADHLILNGFIQCSPNHQIKGMWKHPLDETSLGYRDLKWWIRLAELLERGCLDALFFADVHGTYDTYGGNRDAAVRHAVQFPGIDPTVLISALAAATEHLGFGVTYSTTYFPPFQAAKLFSTLDHLTNGRIAWNVGRDLTPAPLPASGPIRSLAKAYVEVNGEPLAAQAGWTRSLTFRAAD